MKIINFLFSILIFSIYIIPQKDYAQVGCPNANFSEGNFNNWIGFIGGFGMPNMFPGINARNHQIIETSYPDPNTCNNLLSIPEGELFSAKLGNEFGGAESESLSYNIFVTPENSLFIYKYAVVLQDPGHSSNEQPGFSVRIMDNTNFPSTQITENCGIYEVFSGQSGQDFQTCENIKWLPWKTIALNLTPYLGRNLTIEFVTRDCAYDLHYGYAYFLLNVVV